MSNSVVKKIVYFISVQLVSPLCISKGDGILTDNDVLVNGEGVPFIPGYSLAGAMRGYLEKEKQQDCIFGYEDMEKNVGRMSSMFVSDLYFDSTVKTAVRDGVSLSDKKTAISQGKFDMEVIDTGASGHFYMELQLRQNDKEDDFLEQLAQVFCGWKKKEIRLGSKKFRGYGEIGLVSVKQKEFCKNNILEYKDAYCIEKQQDGTWETVDIVSLRADMSRYVTVSLPLRLEGGISIRQYGAKKGEPDYVHITANGEPVIPGTSFAGAIRHRLREILLQLGAVNTQKIIDNMFGYVNAEMENDAHISNIVIGECVLKNSQKLIMVRNGISRFESGTKDGALFKEVSYIGGTTVLEIRVKKTPEVNEMIGLLLLVLKDIQNGFLAVGGQTAVGRGLFAANGELCIQSELTQEMYGKATFTALRRE